jgi:hypothetical protein
MEAKEGGRGRGETERERKGGVNPQLASHVTRRKSPEDAEHGGGRE